MKKITLNGRDFQIYITQQAIAARVQDLGAQISAAYADRTPLFLGVLNGAFLFSADLARACEGLACEWHFVKLSSYEGMHSTGEIATKIGFDLEKIRNRHVIVVEDIVDTGRTLSAFLAQIEAAAPASVALAAAFAKPDSFEFPISVDYCGFEIPPAFVVGYGLDYDGFGRNFGDLYQLVEA